MESRADWRTQISPLLVPMYWRAVGHALILPEVLSLAKPSGMREFRVEPAGAASAISFRFPLGKPVQGFHPL
jgi:hypothetical protein